MCVMTTWTELEPLIRMSAFIGALGLFSVFEALWPRKERTQKRIRRWSTNVIMLVMGTGLLRVISPVLTVSWAATCSALGIGLFNALSMPQWVQVLLALVAMDFAIYAQHVAMHRIPVLWAFHKVHHADEDLDASSGIRFHPGEMAMSFGFKLVLIALLGPSALAVFLFEVILNVSAMFNHANWKLPLSVDGVLRRLVVTPDMHRVHHSVQYAESNRNFGFALSVWDRLFRTYQAQPDAGHSKMKLGLDTKPEGVSSGLVWGLILPFRR